MDDVRELAAKYEAETLARTRTQVTGVGSRSLRAEAAERGRVGASSSFSGLPTEIATGWQDGTLISAIYERATAPDFEPEDGFDPTTREEMGRMSWAEQGAFREASSSAEFDYLLAKRDERLDRARDTAARGGIGAVGQLIGGLADIDLPIALLPIGGQVYKGARLTRMLKAAAAASASSAAIETANQAVRGTGEWAGVPLAALTGLALGSLGGIRGPRIQEGLRRAQDEIGELGEQGWENVSRSRDVEQPDIPERPEDSEWVKPSEVDGLDTETPDAPDAPVERVMPFEQTVEEVTAKYEGARPFELDPETAVVEKVNDEFGPARPYNPKDDEGKLGGSVGAARASGARLARDVDSFYGDLDDVQKRTIQAAEDWYSDFSNTALDDKDVGAGVTMARKFEQFMAENPLAQKIAPDFLRMFSAGGNVMKKLAFDLLESPTGLARNHRSAAILRETYHARIMGPMAQFNSTFQSWAKARGYGKWQRYMDDEKARGDFHREVILELNRRRRTGNRSKAVNPSTGRVGDVNVHAAADMIEKADEVAFGIGRGRNGERAVDGFKDIEYKRGYIPQVWKPDNLHRAIVAIGEDGVRELIKRGYKSAHPDIEPKLADAMAKAVMRRMRARELDADEGLIGLLDQDGRNMLRQTLRDSGVKANEIESILGSLTGKLEERGKAGFAKGRVEIDMDVEFNGVRLVDMFETDVNVIYGRYARAMAGRASLARKGITNDAMRRHLIDTALEEQRILEMRGEAVNKISRDELEAIFSYFGSGPVNREVSAVNRRLRFATNLALLNQLGLTQMAETGIMIWSAGIENFFGSFNLGDEIARMKQRGETHPVLKEFEAFGGRVGEEHLLFRDELSLDETRDPKAAQGFLGKLDKALMRGQRLQGYTSLFFHARRMQQRLAVISMANKTARLFTDRLQATDLHKVFTSDDPIALAHSQLKNLGISGRRKQRIREAIQKHAEFDDRGHLVRLNMEKWGTTTAEDFALAMNRHSAQVVQKALAGEENIWWHSEMGTLLTHLKRFPLLALSKQAARLGRLNPGTGEVGAALAMSMVTAGLTVMAKEEINNIGTDREFNEGFWFETARGALAYSNLTGALPMVVDPMAAILGLEDYRFYNYGPPGQATAVPMPPSFDIMNRMAKLPGAALGLAGSGADALALPGLGDGDNPMANMSSSDVNVLKTLPIVGNAYGFSAMFNWTKEQIKSDKAAERARTPVPEESEGTGELGSGGVF